MTSRKVSTTPLSRRSLLKAGGVAAAYTALSPMILRSAEAADDKLLYVNTWGGTWTAAEKKHFFEPFTAETGIQIRTVEPVSLARLKATVQAQTHEFDVISIASVEATQAFNEGLVETFDADFPRDKIWKGGIVGNYGIKSIANGQPMIFNKNKFPNGGPQSWADFWDVKKFPGNRSLLNAPAPTLGYALLADGVALDKIFPMDLDRAFKKLKELKPHIKVWWTQGGQSEQLMKDGEVDLMTVYSSRAKPIIQAGVPLGFNWNQTYNDVGSWMITKNSPRKAAAQKFLEFIQRPIPHAGFATEIQYGATNPEAIKLMKPEDVEQTPTAPSHFHKTFQIDTVWMAPKMPEIRERWAEFMAG